jgi:hypothetical protein
MSELIRAANLWSKKSASTGAQYLVGRMGGVRVLVFPNARRGEEGEPDFHLCFAPAPDNTKPAGAIPHQQRAGLADMRELETEGAR